MTKPTTHFVPAGWRRHKNRASQPALIASAAVLSISQLKKVARTAGWQEEAWVRYDQVTELRYGAGWLSNACSRTRLYVGRIDPNGSSEPIPTDDGDGAQVPLDELFDGQTGQGEMLRRLAIHMNIPGESYLCGFDYTDPNNRLQGSRRRWVCASADEIDHRRGVPELRMPDSDEKVKLDPEKSTIIRLWRPHPRIGWEADSPVRGLRGPLKQLLDLDAHVSATAQSRLAGAGILFIPDNVSLAVPTESDSPNPVETDPFMAGLIEAMITPLNNRDSAAAIVPMVARVPADAIDSIKHVTFSTPFDERVETLREAAIRRIANGLDIPPEVLLGMGDVNHWSAWAIEESAVKLHVEPLLALIVDALTVRYLRPALEALKHPDPGGYAIWFDTSDVVMKANKGPDSLTLYGQGLIGADAARRENGFSDEDAPDEQEAQTMLATRIALGNAQLAPYLLPMLGIDIPGGFQAPTTMTPDIGPHSPAPAQATGQGPQPGIPQSGPNAQGQLAAAAVPAAPAADPWLVAVSEMATLRALERSGKWLLRRNRAYRGKYAHIDSDELHLHISPQSGDLDDMLSGAYTEFHSAVPGHDRLHQVVDDYVRFLLLAGRAHTRHDLVRVLAASGVHDTQVGIGAA
ncbi:hypothetical protein ACIBG8_54305 [Nonomuraea sp. NPDC050556]|uniref:hypothetical protein n=1 Tax=Nonomuraea sp. NPDC050556 TaxID=3364369 RepID=UPI00379416AA